MPAKKAATKRSEKKEPEATPSTGDLGSPVTKLTKQQAVALKHLSNGATMADALRKAHYGEGTARKQNSAITKPIRQAFTEAAERRGLTADAIAERLHTRMYSLTLKVINGQRGEVLVMEDGGVQLRACEIASDILGLKAPQKHEHEIKMKAAEAKQRYQSTANRVAGYLVND